jgi:hypothetical protein
VIWFVVGDMKVLLAGLCFEICMLQDMLASRYACLLVYASRYEVYACWFMLLLAGLCLKERHSEPQNCSQVAVILKKHVYCKQSATRYCKVSFSLIRGFEICMFVLLLFKAFVFYILCVEI